MEKVKEKKLNDSQKKFCEEYIYDFNATRAYQRAYPEAKYETCKTEGNQHLTKPHIKAYIEKLQSNLSETAGISRLKILKEFEKLAFSSIADMHNTWVTRKQFEDLTEAQKSCISEIQTQLRTSRDSSGVLTENEYVKIKLYDKTKALDSINKMLGFNEPDKVDITGEGIAPVIIQKVSEDQ